MAIIADDGLRGMSLALPKIYCHIVKVLDILYSAIITRNLLIHY